MDINLDPIDIFPEKLISCKMNESNNANREIKKETLYQYDTIGIFFSAHWCEPCKQFTTTLIETYNSININKKVFEVIYIPYDRDKNQFIEYSGQMPWLAIDYDSFEVYDKIKEELKVESIPNLLVFIKKEKEKKEEKANKDEKEYEFVLTNRFARYDIVNKISFEGWRLKH